MLCEEEENGLKPAEVRYDGDIQEIFATLSGLIAIFAANLISDGLTLTEVKKLIGAAAEIAFIEDVDDCLAVKFNEKKNGLKVLRGGLS